VVDEVAREKLIVARMKLLVEQPFFAYLALHLELVEGRTHTAGVDGRHFFYNPEYIRTLSNRADKPEIQGLWCHEVLHLALDHLGRRGTREGLRWNIACDYAVNAIIKRAAAENPEGLVLPEGCLYDESFENMSAEEIYPLIKTLDVWVCGKFWHDDHDLWEEATTEEERKTLAREWKERVSRAAHTARQQGKLPGHLETLVEDLIEPRLDFSKYLRNFVLTASKNDYRLSPPHKKHLWRGFYMPSFYGEAIEIAVAVDTSGSINDEEIKFALSEIWGICQQFTNHTLHLIQCDAQIQDYTVLKEFDELPRKVKGRGGTDFRPVFDLIRTKNLNISALIYFTDTYGTFPEQAPPYPVLWVIWQERDVPFGEKIIYKR